MSELPPWAPWMEAKHDLVSRAEIAGHLIARNEAGGIIEADSLFPEDHHTSIHCAKCGDSWCYFCNDLVEPCDES